MCYIDQALGKSVDRGCCIDQPGCVLVLIGCIDRVCCVD